MEHAVSAWDGAHYQAEQLTRIMQLDGNNFQRLRAAHSILILASLTKCGSCVVLVGV